MVGAKGEERPIHEAPAQSTPHGPTMTNPSKGTVTWQRRSRAVVGTWREKAFLWPRPPSDMANPTFWRGHQPPPGSGGPHPTFSSFRQGRGGYFVHTCGTLVS